MENFENIYILKGSLTEEQALKEIENIKQYFTDVKIFEKENDINGYLGLKRLAYPVKGEETGYYFVTYFEGTVDNVFELERQFKLDENIIKWVTVRI